MARQELTLKQRKWLNNYVECGNLTEAAEKAGYKATSKRSFQQIGHENLSKLGFKIKPILAAKGLDGFEFSKILREGLDLPKTHPSRHKYLETFGKVADLFAPDRHEHSGPNGKPIETRNEFDLATRLLNDENANKLVHTLLNIAGKPGGNGGEPEQGPVGPGETLGTPEPKVS